MEQNKDHSGAAVRGEAVADSGWISVKDAMPPLRDGFILVTNNIDAMDSFGNMSHIWMTSMVHIGNDGDLSAFAHPGFSKVEGITHWRFAVPAAAPVAGSEPTEQNKAIVLTCQEAARKLLTYAQIYTGDKQACRLVEELTNIARALSVSARAADAPSEPRGLTFDQWLDRKDENGWTEREAPCGEFRDMLRGWNAAMKFGKSRAADALDSQPTELKDELRQSPDPKYWAREFCKRNPACQEITIAGWFEQAFAAAIALSSQPTDGGVRNG